MAMSEDVACLPLHEVKRVVFYKRDEITTDLICCDVEFGSTTRTFHEEMASWGMVLAHLKALPGFDQNWFRGVSQPPFATSETIAFIRQS